jgi:exonuclease III
MLVLCDEHIKKYKYKNTLQLLGSLHKEHQMPPPSYYKKPSEIDKALNEPKTPKYKSGTLHDQLHEFIATKHPSQTTHTQVTNKFPYIPKNMIEASLKTKEPIPGLHIPENTPAPTTNQTNNTYTTEEIDHTTSNVQYLLTWNTGSIQSSLPSLDSVLNKTSNPAIVFLQETKLSKNKSHKYIDKLFPEYYILYNGINSTNTTNRYMPYQPVRGGTAIAISKKYHTKNSTQCISTPINISPYLQAITLTQATLKPLTLMNLYMPTHDDDMHLVPLILDSIAQITTSSKIKNHNIILAGDFNRDIALIGRKQESITHPPNAQDKAWARFTNKLGLKYIPTNTDYSRQGGSNYTSQSLIYGYYKTEETTTLQCTTDVSNIYNSDHFPILLNLPNNTIILPNKPSTNTQERPYIPSPIPHHTLLKFHTMFEEESYSQVQTLQTQLNTTEHPLTFQDWENAKNGIEGLIQTMTECTLQSCCEEKLEPQTDRSTKQGGYIPHTIKKNGSSNSTYITAPAKS